MKTSVHLIFNFSGIH